ncbi:MAG: FkbM family methyltransferase [Deltaproteobacteria bacterium]|nr:FkbM family methyltransferase [Deltaproteobacteria bacterium]
MKSRIADINQRIDLVKGIEGDFLVLKNDIGISDGIRREGVWVGHDVKLFKQLISPGMCVADIGANLGHHTVVFSKQVGNSGRVIACEPQALLFQLLNANLALNNCLNVITQKCAIGERRGQLKLWPVDYDKPDNFGALGISRHHGEVQIEHAGEDVEILSTDEFLLTYLPSLDQVDFVKIDVQTYELYVLQGAKELLQGGRPLVFLEISPYWMKRTGYDYQDIYHLLWQYGYQLFEPHTSLVEPVGIREWSGDNNEEWDLLAVPSEKSIITVSDTKGAGSKTRDGVHEENRIPVSEEAQDSEEQVYEQPARLASIFKAPALQILPERLLIYSLVFGLRPECCLEIGSYKGGAALIICSAMDDIDCGRLVCVDSSPQITPETWNQMEHRTKMVKGVSPDILPKAFEAYGIPFDFVFIDGDHSHNAVLNDIEGVLPYLADQAYLLFHDSHYYEVGDAIDVALRRYPDQLLDCGDLSTTAVSENREVDGRSVEWGGVRLLRFCGKKGSKQGLQNPERSLMQHIASRVVQSWPGKGLSSLISFFRN